MLGDTLQWEQDWGGRCSTCVFSRIQLKKSFCVQVVFGMLLFPAHFFKKAALCNLLIALTSGCDDEWGTCWRFSEADWLYHAIFQTWDTRKLVSYYVASPTPSTALLPQSMSMMLFLSVQQWEKQAGPGGADSAGLLILGLASRSLREVLTVLQTTQMSLQTTSLFQGSVW